MKIIECNGYEQISKEAAKIVAAQITLNPNTVLGLATGSTPLGLYGELIKACKNNELDFSNVKSFNLDEYYPIKRSSDQSYYYFMHKNLFDKINIKEENIHVLNGEAENPEAECANFEELIKKSGGIDLQVLGIGQNGHIGFNEPDDHLESLTHVTSLTKNTIEANSRFFSSVSDVPTKALTMGVATIMKARKIIILATGANKAEAVKALISGKITTQNASTILNMHKDVTLIADKEALR